MRHIVHLVLILTAAMVIFACGDAGGSTDQNRAGVQNSASDAPAASADETTTDTPTAAYKRLFAAVKAKNTENIKAVMSKKTQSLAEMLSQRQKQSIEKSYENGFTATTFAGSLPDVRDERIKGKFGAVEVWNHRDSKWEDLPFILEGGSWKLAIGELFEGTFESPGPGLGKGESGAASPEANTNGKVPANVGKNSNN